MDNTTKMFLVPMDIVNKINNKSFSNMDKEMHDILYTSAGSDSDKWKSYTHILQKYLHAVDESEKPLEIKIVSPSLTNREIEDKTTLQQVTPRTTIDTLNAELPAKYRDKANSLYNILTNSTHIEWDGQGEISVEGVKIDDSNIVALIKSAVKGKSLPVKPTGWDKFTEAVISSNVPREALGANIDRNIIVIQNRNQHLLVPSEKEKTPFTNKLRPTTKRKERVGPYSGPWATMKM
jgi:hypothetical protein